MSEKPLTKKEMSKRAAPKNIVNDIRKQYRFWNSPNCTDPPKNRQEVLSKKYGYSLGTINKILRGQGVYENV